MDGQITEPKIYGDGELDFGGESGSESGHQQRQPRPVSPYSRTEEGWGPSDGVGDGVRVIGQHLVSLCSVAIRGGQAGRGDQQSHVCATWYCAAADGEKAPHRDWCFVLGGARLHKL